MKITPFALPAGWARAAGCVAVLLALGGGGGPAGAQADSVRNNLPALGDDASQDLDLLAERKLGDRVMRDIRRDPDYLDDPLLLEYLQRLWQPLRQAAQARGDIPDDLERLFAWEPFLVRDRTVNAFAMPGGYMGVHLGLIALTGSADELAAVLAHELSHITQRHIARGMVSSQRQGLATAAAVLLGLVLASRSATVDAAQAVMVGGQAVAMQHQLNFSREMEREADRVGWQVLNTAGFAPGGMAAMFEKLDNSSRLNDSNQYPYLRTHPLTIDRIAEARLRTPAGAPAVGPVSLAEHALMQARAKVLVDGSEPALRRMQALGAPGSPGVGPARLGALYGAALASLQLRDMPAYQQAIASALAWVGQGPDAASLRRTLTLLQLQATAERTPAVAAAQTLQGPLAQDRTRPALLLRAQAALAGQRGGDPQADSALRNNLQALQGWVVEHRQDAAAWQALAQTAQTKGQTLRAQRASAEVAAALGDTLGAVERMRVAQPMVRNEPTVDYVEASVVQSRLRELEAERRRQMSEAKGPGE